LKTKILLISLLIPLATFAQIGEHRNTFSVGINGGYVLSSVGFTPKVTQSQHGGITGGLSVRYTSEKYFKTYCSIYGEINFMQAGWKEKIVDINENPVINTASSQPEEYSRLLSYIDVPIFAQLAWGRENKGCKFYVQAGPKIGFMLSEKTTTNFNFDNINLDDRANKEITQYGMDVENKFDYGIAAGLGFEYTMPHVGHFILEGRYNFSLGNIYGNSKRDYFSKSNNTALSFKVIYMFDIKK